MSLEGRKVKMFRCHIDPHIPPRPQNAFMMGDGSGQTPGSATYYPGQGVFLKIPVRDLQHNEIFREFLIPYSQLENIEFLPEEEKKTKLKPA